MKLKTILKYIVNCQFSVNRKKLANNTLIDEIVKDKLATPTTKGSASKDQKKALKRRQGLHNNWVKHHITVSSPINDQYRISHRCKWAERNYYS